MKYRIRYSRKLNLFDCSWFWAFLLVPFMKPAYFSEIRLIDFLFDAWRIVALEVIIFIYIYRRKFSRAFVLVVIFALLRVASTLLNHGNLSGAIANCLIIIGVFSTIDLAMQLSPRMITRCFLPVMEVLIYLNLATILAFPEGLYKFERETGWSSQQAWFMGLRNSHIAYYMIAVYLSVLRVYERPGSLTGKVRAGIMMATVILSVIMINSSGIQSAGGTTVGLLLLLFYFFLPGKLKSWKLINFKNVWLMNVIIFVFLVVLKLQFYFSFLITNILGKSLSLSGRTLIWNYALEAIKMKPLLGYGVEAQRTMADRLHSSAAVTCHNTFLDIAYFGGLLSVAVMILLIIKIYRQVKDTCGHQVSIWTAYILFSFLLTGQTEGFSGYPLFMVLAFSLHIPDFIREDEKDLKLWAE